MSSVLNTVGQMLGGHLQRVHERKMYDLQVANNLAQWNRQNEYDSPAAQMARFESAGLNPNLIYGQMGNGQSATNIATPTVSDQSSNIGNALGQMAPNVLAARLTEAQVHNINADTANKEAEGKKIGAETYNIEESTKLITSTIDKIKVEMKVSEETAIKLAIENFWANKRNPVEFDNLNTSRDLLLKQIDTELAKQKDFIAHADLLLSQRNLTEKEIKYFDSKVASLLAYQNSLTNQAEADSLLKLYQTTYTNALEKLTDKQTSTEEKRWAMMEIEAVAAAISAGKDLKYLNSGKFGEYFPNFSMPHELKDFIYFHHLGSAIEDGGKSVWSFNPHGGNKEHEGHRITF